MKNGLLKEEVRETERKKRYIMQYIVWGDMESWVQWWAMVNRDSDGQNVKQKQMEYRRSKSRKMKMKKCR